jgi:hypothetical protein
MIIGREGCNGIWIKTTSYECCAIVLRRKSLNMSVLRMNELDLIGQFRDLSWYVKVILIVLD